MPSIVDDVLTVVAWSITYLMIVYAGFRSTTTKKVSMPYTAGVLNVAWEICALYWTAGFWGYFLWLGIDVFIVFFGFRFLDSKAKRFLYLLSIVLCTLVLLFAFWKINNGFVYTVYAIDLIMAICYLLEHKKISSVLKIPIAIARLVGDFFAGFVFKQYPVAVVIAMLVFVINSVYLYLCIKERAKTA